MSATFDLRRGPLYDYGGPTQGGTGFNLGLGYDVTQSDNPNNFVRGGMEAGIGEFVDHNGEVRRGASFEARVFEAALQTEDGQGVDTQVGGVSAELAANDHTFTAGAQATAGEVGLTMGGLSRRTGNDTQVRVAASAGPGAALRLHYGDTDGDGAREFGFGADFLAAGFDIRHEFGGGMGPARLPGGPTTCEPIVDGPTCEPNLCEPLPIPEPGPTCEPVLCMPEDAAAPQRMSTPRPASRPAPARASEAPPMSAPAPMLSAPASSGPQGAMPALSTPGPESSLPEALACELPESSTAPRVMSSSE